MRRGFMPLRQRKQQGISAKSIRCSLTQLTVLYGKLIRLHSNLSLSASRRGGSLVIRLSSGSTSQLSGRSTFIPMTGRRQFHIVCPLRQKEGRMSLNTVCSPLTGDLFGYGILFQSSQQITK